MQIALLKNNGNHIDNKKPLQKINREKPAFIKYKKVEKRKKLTIKEVFNE